MSDFPPQSLNGEVVLSSRQVRLHKRAELIAVVGAPLVLWMALKKGPLEPWQKATLAGFAVGSLVVDSYLYTRWPAKRAGHLKNR